MTESTTLNPDVSSTNIAQQPQAPVADTPSQPESAKHNQSSDETPVEVDFASKFAALTRREKAIIRKQKEAEEKYGKAIEYEKAISEAKKNPIKFLESVGLSYQQITDYLLTDGKPTIESQLEELRAQYENDRKRQEQEKENETKRKAEEQEAYLAQVVENHKKQISVFLDSNRDNYELCALNNAADDIFDVIEEYYNTHNEILSIDKAADAVEKYLEQEAEKLFTTKKLSAKRQSPDDGAKTTPPGSVSKTITNMVGEFSPMDTSQLSDEESKAVAAKLLKWT